MCLHMAIFDLFICYKTSNCFTKWSIVVKSMEADIESNFGKKVILKSSLFHCKNTTILQWSTVKEFIFSKVTKKEKRKKKKKPPLDFLKWLLKGTGQPSQKILAKNLTPYFLDSNLYLHFLRSCCENIFKMVRLVSDKSSE